jgi:branched-chain amino acid transport system permease protein
MELFLHQVLAGSATGGIYACMALAVVMIYQAIDHLNFAQGEMAMFSTFIAWQLIQWGLPYWLAVRRDHRHFVRGRRADRARGAAPIHDAPILSHVVAFIALLSILNSGAGFLWDWTIKNFASPFGSGQLFGPEPDRPA